MTIRVPPRSVRLRPAPTDVLLAAVMTVIMLVGSPGAARSQMSTRHALDALAYVLLVVAGLPLLVRRIWPYPAFAVVTAVVIAYLFREYPHGPILVTLGIAVYSVAIRGPTFRSLLWAEVAMGAVLVPDVIHLDDYTVDSITLLVASRTGFLLVPWGIGTIVRLRREYLDQVRGEEVRRRADEERLRIAREVHDVVGHGLSVINMQAGIALHIMSRRPEQAAVALEAIRKTSKDALDELRTTLAVFRHPGDGDQPRRPAPGLGQVGSLVDAMSGNGLPVELVVAGERGELPSSVDHAGYRIVQESLTNVLRHAGKASARVHIGYHEAAVEIEVTDNGRGVNAPTGGHGIAGMRERAAAVGGTLEAGPRPEGGFAVHAHLPYGESGP